MSGANSFVGKEHWRLSYRKRASELKPSSSGLIASGANAVSLPMKGASSEANVTFQVTLAPPSAEPERLQDEDEPNSSHFHYPRPPPSTPIEPAEAHDSGTKTDQEMNRRSDTTYGSTNFATSEQFEPVASMFELEIEKNYDKQKRAASSASSLSLVASGSSSSISSNLIATKSILTSQSESGLIRSTSSYDSSDDQQVLEPPLAGGLEVPRANRRQERRRLKMNEKSKLGENRRKSERSIRGFIMKEIDLTEARTIDCDTSADEDKVSTSSGGIYEDGGSGSDSGESEGKIGPAEGDEDKSFRILTRLNSVRLVNEDSDRENSDSEGESSVLLKQRCPNFERNKHRLFYDKRKKNSKGDIKERSSRGAHKLAATENSHQAHEKGPLPSSNGHRFKTIDTKQPPDDEVDQASGSRDSRKYESDSRAFSISIHRGRESVCKQLQSASKQTNQQTTQTATPLPSCASQASGLRSKSPSSRMTTPRSSFQHHASENSISTERISKAGVVVTSSAPRVTSRRSSTASSASAFAAATAASNNPILTQPPLSLKQPSSINQTAQFRKFSTDLAAKQNFDNSDSLGCTCSSYCQRGSVSSQGHQTGMANHFPPTASFHQQSAQQQSQKVHRRSNDGGRLNAIAHHPSCNLHQQVTLASPSCTPSDSYLVGNSDASSLCNSRASSRFSSSAGIDYSSCPSAQVNLSHLNLQQCTTSGQAGNSRGLVQNQPARMSSSASGQAFGRGVQSRSKRDSAQINIRSVATIRVLSVLRHWVSKHSQDFVNDTKLSFLVQEFLQDLIMDPNLLPAEHKAALQLQQMVQKAALSRGNQVDLDLLLAAPSKPSPNSIETLSALEIAEGMTYLDHKIFLAIRSEEFLGQAWMKMDKAIRAPHILLITKRFNDVSRLVSSEIIRVPELHRRVAIIEKWTNVAHICRVVHNFNGVLQICAAFTNSAVFRLKKTWDKIPKTVSFSKPWRLYQPILEFFALSTLIFYLPSRQEPPLISYRTWSARIVDFAICAMQSIVVIHPVFRMSECT